jgi:hypothetical protein
VNASGLFGRRPAVPVRQADAPDDWLCTWAYRIAVWTAPCGPQGVWELKFINAACRQHNHLPAA